LLRSKPSALERLLGVFAPVEPREGPTVLLMALNVFLLLMAYYILKVLREPLILVGGGAELKSYASAGQALLLLLVVPVYGRLASRVGRATLLTAVLLFFIGCLVAFYVLVRTQVPIGLVFYVWLGMFSVMVVASFWSFANDIYTPEQGKRLFAIVAFGGSLGSIAGAFLPERLGALLGTYELFLVAAAVLGVAILLFRVVNAREARALDSTGTVSVPRSEAVAPLQRHGGFQIVARDRYLRMIAVLIFLSTVVNTTGEYVVGKMVEQQARQEAAAANAAAGAPADVAAEKERERAYVRRFYSNYFGLVNLVSAVLQAFAVSRLIKLLGVGRGLLLMPAVVVLGWLAFAAIFTIGTIRVTKTIENSIDYSLQNTLKQALYLPTSRESKYKAKAAIDGFVFRFGDVVAAFGLVYLFSAVLALSLRTVAMINAALVVVWFAVALRTWRLHDLRTEERAARAALGLRETVV
jgi:ATP:ADP antiporter, AAA family